MLHIDSQIIIGENPRFCTQRNMNEWMANLNEMERNWATGIRVAKRPLKMNFTGTRISFTLM